MIRLMFPCLRERYRYNLLCKSLFYNYFAKVKFIRQQSTESWRTFLHIPSRFGREIYPFVKPFFKLDTLDINDIEKLASLRGLKVNTRLLETEILNLKELQNHLEALSNEEHATRLLKQNTEGMSNENILALQTKLKELNHKIHSLHTKISDCEEKILPMLLTVPNKIHSNVPRENSILEQFGETRCNKIMKSHVEIGENTSSLIFSPVSFTAYYLKGITALLELAIINYFCDQLKSNHYLQISCPDVFKSIILEGFGDDPYSSQTICLSDEKSGGNMFHLTGSASKEAVGTFITRNSVNKSFLPLCCFTVGRNYNGANKFNCTQSLFSTVQSTQMEYCIASEEDNIEKHLIVTIEILKKCYEKINIPFRIINVGAANLELSESQKIQFELWTPHLNKYIISATIIFYGDYVSKRLQMKYGPNLTESNFLHTIFGTVVNVPVLLGCIMENNQTEDGSFTVPHVLESYM